MDRRTLLHGQGEEGNLKRTNRFRHASIGYWRLGVKDRGVSLCFVAFRFVWQVGSGYGGGRRKLSAAIGAKLALGGCVGMRMDVWERCDE